MRMPKCKKCGSDIKFIHLRKSGKWIPVDMYKHTLKECWGNQVIVTEQGDVVRGEFCTPEEGANTSGYTSHFATCPYADNFRKET